MAAPTYTTDLTELTAAETLVYTRNTSAPFGGGGNITLEAAVDFAIQGTNSNIFAVSNRYIGVQYDAGAAVTAMTDSDHIFQWLFIGPAGLTSSLNNGGGVVWAGSASGTDRVIYNVFGNDTYGSGGRNNICFSYNYRQFQTSVTNRRTAQGTPGASPQFFGAGVDVTAATKGQNCAVDALRWGRGHFIQGGDVTNGFANFAGLASFNDNINNRYGVFSDVGGSYELQGLLAIGQTNADVADSCSFFDENSSIIIPDLLHSATDAANIEIRGTATSKTIITSMSLTALGTLTPGIFNVVNKSNEVVLTRCSFSGTGNTIFSNNSTIASSTWTGCDTVFQDSASMNLCNFVESTSTRAAIVSENPNLITNSSWVSPGTGHGIELALPGTYDATNWSQSGYFDSAGTNLTPNNGSTDAFLYNNSGGDVTIQLRQGTPSFSVRNGVGATTTVQAVATISVVQLLGLSEIKVLPTSGSPYSGNALGTAIATAETVSADTFVGNGTDYISYSNNGGNVRINTNGAFVFTNQPGVLSDANGALAAGDEVCVQVRDNSLNSSLQLLDIFEVSGTPTTTTIDTTTTFSTFVSNFGTALNGANSLTVAVERKDATFSFDTLNNISYDILIFRIGSDPVLLTEQIAVTGNLPISQTGDRNYENPA